ncbi:MAG: cytochrome c oxidase assembly protein [Alphaproteobacteria bacterium]|nr:cytochrome c oxidase assembly protein [Alphaproteobacteria bacterium]
MPDETAPSDQNSESTVQDEAAEQTRKNARMGLSVLLAVTVMIGISFASVPLYSVFCRVTGFGGTTQTAESLPGTILDRIVTVQFNADTSRKLPWIFEPEVRSIKVRLGERGLTAFRAQNKSSHITHGMALYNVTPPKAGKYFHKIQCFCFDEQQLEPNQRVSMPVVFYVDPEMDKDPNMVDVKTITLSYTFFPAETEELEDAVEGFYNDADPAIKATN